MITCTVHEKFDADKDVEARAESIRFVKEGIAWWALVFPAVWLFYHRLWIVLIAYLVLVFAIAAGFQAAGAPEPVGGIVTMAVSVLLALEGNDLRRWTLARKGFQLVDVTTGRDMEECERRFFEGWLPGQGRVVPPSAALTETPAAQPKGAAGGDGVIGLFPEPGR